MRKHFMLRFIIIVFALGLAGQAMAAPVPAGEWLFNETGTLANSTGSNTALDLTLRNQTGAVADMHSADGLGVTGQSGDRAFDNTGATNMGTGYSSRADISDSNTGSPASNALDGLTNFTLSGWFRTDATISGTNPGWLFNNYYYSPGTGFTGYGLYYTAGELRFLMGHYLGYDLAASTPGAYSGNDTWIFFAAAVRGSSPGPAVSFYIGTPNTPVSLVNTVTGASVFQGGSAWPDVQYFTLGSTSYFTGASSVQTSQPFDGLLDDMRVFGSTLTLADLESVRSLAVVPVPAGAWLLASALGALGGLARAARRARQATHTGT
jgi:hypothetical protein